MDSDKGFPPIPVFGRGPLDTDDDLDDFYFDEYFPPLSYLDNSLIGSSADLESTSMGIDALPAADTQTGPPQPDAAPMSMPSKPSAVTIAERARAATADAASGTKRPRRAASARVSAAVAEEKKILEEDEEEDLEITAKRVRHSAEPRLGRGSRKPSSTSSEVAKAAITSHSSDPATVQAAVMQLTSDAANTAAARVAALDFDNEEDDVSDSSDDEEPTSSKRSKRRDGGEKVAKSRERNRLHARKSRLRKKFFVDSLKANLEALEDENKKLRAFIQASTGKSAEQVVFSGEQGEALEPVPVATPGLPVSAYPSKLLARPGHDATTVIEAEDYKLMESLALAQQNFVVSDPNLPDNPIVFASQGFYRLTGYTPAEVIGRNCRFLQGPGTDAGSVSMLRNAIRAGRDCSVCVLNYKKDGTPFWNSFFVAALKGVDGRIVNYVGVQCEVKDTIAKSLVKMQNFTGNT